MPDRDTTITQIARSWLLLIGLLFATACGQVGESLGFGDAETSLVGARVELDEDAPLSTDPDDALALVLELSDAPERAPAPPREPSPTTPLSAAEAEALLARTEALRPQADDELPRLPSLPAPPAAPDQQLAVFPPPSELPPPPRPDAPPAPLRVLSVQPEGEREIVPQLLIAFSEPMVALGSEQALAPSEVPARLVPQPAGAWRWVDPTLLAFEPAPRFTGATHFELQIPAGTRSLGGSVLAEDVVSRLSTPAPRLLSHFPRSRFGLPDAVIGLRFDQRVSAAQVLEHASLIGEDGRRRWNLRELSEEELAADASLRSFLEGALPGTTVVLKPRGTLPMNASFEFELSAGLPSAEGPRRTSEPQSFAFNTPAPLALRESKTSQVAWSGLPSSVRLIFNNPIQTEVSRDALQVEVTPAVEELSAELHYNSLSLTGRFEPGRHYEIEILPGLLDTYGQRSSTSLHATLSTTFPLPQLTSALAGRQLVRVLDPFQPAVLELASVNVGSVRLRAYRASAAQLPQLFRDADGFEEIAAHLGGDALIDTVRPLQPELEGAWHRWLLGLGAGFPDDSGHLLVGLDTQQVHFEFGSTLNVDESTEWAWLQRTRLAADVFADETDLAVWCTSLLDGRPLVGARVSTLGREGEPLVVTSDTDGLAILPLPSDAGSIPALLVEHEGDELIVVRHNWAFARQSQIGWQRSESGVQLLWHQLDDRGLYRPGETVSVTGFVREHDLREGGGVAAWPEIDGQALSWIARSARREEIARGELRLDAAGRFALSFELPEEIALGRGTLELSFDDQPRLGRSQHSFQVREFRRPEYEVSLELPSEPVLPGATLELATRAAYFAGGGLRGAPVQWDLYERQGSLPHPAWEGWSFGRWVPWWGGWHGEGGFGRGSRAWQSDPAQTWAHLGSTDAEGEHRLSVELQGPSTGYAVAVQVESSVTDDDAQQWGSSGGFLIAPAELSVGLRSARGFVRAGEELPLELIVVDTDDALVAETPVQLRAARRDWKRIDGSWREVESEVVEWQLRSGAEPLSRSLAMPGPGSWRLTASVSDAAERVAHTQLDIWVAGPSPQQTGGKVDAEQLTLIPDAREHAPGDVAEVLVMAPFESGSVQLSSVRSGRLDTQVAALDAGQVRFEIPITEAHLPGLGLRAEAVGVMPREVGAADESQPPRPAYAQGELALSVSLASRRLAVELQAAQDEIRPGAELDVSLCVRDAEGRPLPEAALTLIVVDEAIHVAGGYEFQDVLAAMHPARGQYLEERLLRPDVVLVDLPELLAERLRGADDLFPMLPAVAEGEVSEPLVAMASPAVLGRAGKLSARSSFADSAPMAELSALGDLGSGAGSVSAEAAPAITLRRDLSPLAAFRADLRAGADGCARTTVKLPDRLTRWKLMAIATDGGDRFGQKTAQVTTTLPLRVRASLPRFLRQGDTAQLPVVLHNDTDEPMEVELAVEATRLELLDPAHRLRLPARDRVELLLPARALESGLARLLFVLSDVDDPTRSDALTVTLPVERPTTLEAFALYGSSDEDGALSVPLELPAGTRLDAGELQLDLSSTAFASLTDAIVELNDYPYDCTEQIASRLLGLVALEDVLSSFQAAGLPGEAQRAASRERDLEKLAERQKGDGSFGFWSTSSRVNLYLSVHATHALVRLTRADKPVPASLYDRALNFLSEGLEAAIAAQVQAGDLSERSAQVVRAYALSVRGMSSLTDDARRTLRNEALDLLRAAPVDAQPLELLAWLLPLLAGDATLQSDVDAGLAELVARATETAAEARFLTAYEERERAVLLHGERRTDGLVLEALLQLAPDHRLVEKVVRGLLAHRRRGAWGSTQDNVFVLLALGRSFRALEDELPAFTARAWIAGGSGGSGGASPAPQGWLEQVFAGRSAASTHAAIAARQLAELFDAELAPPASGEPARLAESLAGSLLLDKQGPGRLWWRLGLRTAPGGVRQPSRDAGFSVSRVYEALDDPEDVSQLDDGSWRIRRGATVRVRLSLTAPARRHHVALVDPLPAGLEVLDTEMPNVSAPRLVTQNDAARSLPWWWWWRWHDHENLRDEQVEVFAESLGAGVHSFSYLARATTPGDFVLPPARAEEMYAPETFGRGEGSRLIVE